MLSLYQKEIAMTAKMFVRAVAVIVLAIGAGTITSSAQAADLCNNGNVDGTLNNPAKGFTPCSFSSPAHITKIVTYHWNDGRGAVPGTITLRDARTGEKYGPFSVTATSGQGGAPNVYWTANVDITVPAGDYRVIDSDVRTWSWNPASGGNGIVIISGEFTDDEGDSSDDGYDSDRGDDSDDGGR
jgi:hypothetical protein